MNYDNYEILKNLIIINDNNIHLTLKIFLNNPDILNDYQIYEDNNFYINDSILIIKKNDINNVNKGIIKKVDIKKSMITMEKLGNKSSFTFNINQYYCFYKKKLNRNNNREFYNNLLKSL